jgi:AAA domain
VADLRQFLSTRTEGEAQFQAALASVMASSELVALTSEGGAARYTSRDLLEAQKSLLRRAGNLTKRGDFRAVAVREDELCEFLRSAHAHCHERGKQLREAMPAPGETLSPEDMLLVKSAEMLDIKSLEKLLDAAERARAGIVLVADADRLQAMGALSPMDGLVAPSGLAQRNGPA